MHPSSCLWSHPLCPLSSRRKGRFLWGGSSPNLNTHFLPLGGGATNSSSPALKSIDLNRPIDKRIYKGTQPTCHDFNQFTAATETISLLVGFSAGQVQYLDLIKKGTSKLFNEEVSWGPKGCSSDGGGA